MMYPNKFTGVNNYIITKTKDGWLLEHPNQEDQIETDEKEIVEIYNANSVDYNSTSKTRRILEVQSDLFQKGRDKDTLIFSFDTSRENNKRRLVLDNLSYDRALTSEEQKELDVLNNPQIDKTKENQFLQLLNKNNNWVTFFVKSIMQDSAKKGYEKYYFLLVIQLVKLKDIQH